MSTETQTSTTLLRRLSDAPHDVSAWDRFVERYGLVIYRWCRRWGLQDADAQDVTQNVLVELLRQMRKFVYDRRGSFRAWLRTVAYRSWCRFVETQKRRGDLAARLKRLRSSDAYDDLLQSMTIADEREALEAAMAIVRQRVQPHTWDAFRQLAIEGRAGKEVAADLRMNIGAVFVARSKVQRMIREELDRRSLEGTPAEGAEGMR